MKTHTLEVTELDIAHLEVALYLLDCILHSKELNVRYFDKIQNKLESLIVKGNFSKSCIPFHELRDKLGEVQDKFLMDL